MATEFTAFFVSEKEYQAHLRTKIPVSSGSLHPYLKVGIHREFNMYSFYCRLYHSNSGAFNILSKYNASSISPINEYLTKGVPFYLSHNGVTFYKIKEIRIDADGYLEAGVEMIEKNSYVERNHFFMVMPFNNEVLNKLYYEISKQLQSRLNASIFRSDDFTDTDVIIDTIYREIEQSEFVICEITECNKNVFYEIGYARAKDKQLIFLMQKGSEHRFFDVAHIRRIEYEISNPQVLFEQLVSTIQYMRQKSL